METELKELANTVYNTLMGNTDNEQFDVNNVSNKFLNIGENPPTITFAYYNYGEQKTTIYDICIMESKLQACRWCNGTFDPNESEHKFLCSDDCYIAEQACQ